MNKKKNKPREKSYRFIGIVLILFSALTMFLSLNFKDSTVVLATMLVANYSLTLGGVVLIGAGQKVIGEELRKRR